MRASRYDSDADGLELRYVLSPAEDVSHHVHVEALPKKPSEDSLSTTNLTMLQQTVGLDVAMSRTIGLGSGIMVRQEWNVESEPR